MVSTSEFELPQSRSPRYPRYSLSAAIGYAKKLYDGAHRSLVETDTAYRVMGFAGKSGASSSALGAIRQYGLIDAPKGGVRISQIGLKVLEPSNNQEYRESLHVAANQPTVFSQIMAHFDGDLPRSDEPIRAYLIRHLDFSKKGADECISSLRETFMFVEQQVGTESASAADERSSISPEATDVPPTRQHSSNPHVSETSDLELFRIPLTRDCAAELRFEGVVTASAVERLIRHIELMKEVWAEE